MTNQVQELLEKAMALPERDRADLAGSLLETLDTRVDEEVEMSWQKEIAQRMQELDTGKAKTISWSSVRDRLANKLSHRD